MIVQEKKRKEFPAGNPMIESLISILSCVLLFNTSVVERACVTNLTSYASGGPPIRMSAKLLLSPGSAFQYRNGPRPLLILHFHGDADGVDGEMPANISNVSYQDGIHRQGIYLGIDNLLEYAAAGNIDDQTGARGFDVAIL